MHCGGQSDQGSDQQVTGNLIEGLTLTLREVVLAGRAAPCTGQPDCSLPRCPVGRAMDCARDRKSRFLERQRTARTRETDMVLGGHKALFRTRGLCRL
jgi:hypothetical protein